MAISQVPISAEAFGGKDTVAAWKEKPSYAVIATQDRMINPDLAVLFLANRAQAADISVVAYETADHPALILIKGRIGEKGGELELMQFEAPASIQKKPAIVFLDSPGGATVTAIRLGLLIRKHGFSTAASG